MAWDNRQMLSDGLQQRSLESFEFTPLGSQIAEWRASHAPSTWRVASIQEALGVPAIQRAVSLIANTTGSLSVEGLRDGMAMPEPPRIIQRPDPFQTPREFYRDTAYYLATRGEAVWWIAARDGDNLPASLIVVPARELTIEPNIDDRRFPIYSWGNGRSKVISTRYSPLANQTGQFVHMTYLKEPGDLRGKGPLQFCGAAISVTVEAQEWAANFFSGNPSSTEIKSLLDIDEDEANDLRRQWMENRAANLPRVTNPTIELIDHVVDPESAQMTEARAHQDGEAAKMFGIPGKLMEYAAPGSSLTYQNIAEVFTEFVRSCLSINYLEPIEQALSDLLPRTTAARFAVEGLLRADIKTRFEVYEKAITVFGPEEGADYARVGEGRAPGNVEMRPVPFAFPAAVPSSLPEQRSMAELVMQGQDRKIDALFGAVAAIATREQAQPQVTVHQPPINVEPAQVTVEPAQVTVNSPDIHVQVDAPDMSGVTQALGDLATRAQPPIEVNVSNPPDEQLRMALDELRASISAPRNRKLTRDKDGRITGLVEE